MSEAAAPRALLVGSVPLADADEVLRTAGEALGNNLRRAPDGETGVRTNWIGWQREVFARHEAFVAEGERFRLRDGVDAAALELGPLGYAEAARASWARFDELRDEAAIPAAWRFQVSLPTPLAPLVSFLAPEDWLAVEPAYERALLSELEEILAAVQHDSLAIQWDVAWEMALLEGVREPPFADPEREVLDRLVRLGDRIPAGVELGYHLCYGDRGHRHFKEPEDTTLLVRVANGLAAGVRRPVTWIHMPVPRERDDEAYFAPLRELALAPETELYLGLVHATGGAEGTRRRMETAEGVLDGREFGVATECGLGRRDPAQVPALLREHVEALGARAA